MRWRWVGVALVFAFGGLFLVANRSQLPSVWNAAREANLLFLGAAALVALLYLVNYGAMYRAAFRAVGLELPLGAALRSASAAHFLNMTIVNSGGAAGLAVFLREAAARQQGRGLVVSAYLLVAVLGHLVFAVVLGAALAIAASDGQVSRLELIATAVFSLYTVSQIALVVAAARSRNAVRWMHERPAALKRGLRRLFRQRDDAGTEPSNTAADELYDSFQMILRRPGRMALPAFHGLLVEAAGILTLWLCLRAFGVDAGIEEPLVAYAMGVLFSIVGFLPAGVGFAEAGLGLALASFGYGGTEIGLTVVTYRLFEVWVPFAIGALALHASLRRPSAVEA